MKKPTKTTHSESQSEQVLAKVILLGLDVHADSITVVRQVDGGMPQPAQQFCPARLLDWIRRQQGQAETVWSCYEAGPFGFTLHRQLEAMGVRNLVVAPRNWDEGATGVKTDANDARALCVRLALYAAGNRRTFSVVHVPTPVQEQARAQTRLRDQLRRTRQRIEAQGRSLLLAQGHRIVGRWWQASQWQALSATLPGWLVELLEPLRECILTVHQKTEHLTRTVQEASTASLPFGLGALSYEIIGREIGDWKRFSNRRQIASYTGLCPGEHSSGGTRRQGPITKHGNPRLRHVLIETSWRLTRYQPGYRAVAHWSKVLGAPGATGAARKKAIVAVARQLIVDLWRIATGRVRPEELGLVLN